MDALKNKGCIPDDANVVGLVTLEDCIEELIQGEIYDEYDKEERRLTHERMKRVAEKWKAFVAKRKKAREEEEKEAGGKDGKDGKEEGPSLKRNDDGGAVVKTETKDETEMVNESTKLLLPKV